MVDNKINLFLLFSLRCQSLLIVQQQQCRQKVSPESVFPWKNFYEKLSGVLNVVSIHFSKPLGQGEQDISKHWSEKRDLK